MDRLIWEWLYYKLLLEAFTQRNFVADFIGLKLNFNLGVKIKKSLFEPPFWD